MRGNRSTIERFQDLAEFIGLVENRDEYRLLPAFTDFAGERVPSTRLYAMTNITHKRVTMGCGENYPVFGHREALGYVAKELKVMGLGVHGNITTVGDTTWTKILFDNSQVKDETDQRVEMGVEFVNPMDRKTRFKGHAYTWRQTCSNGAGIMNLLPNLTINESHTRNMEIIVPPLIYDFMHRVVASSGQMQGMVNRAIEQKVVFTSKAQVEKTIQSVMPQISERHIKRIANVIDVLDPTRWDLFNAANFYTSHSAVSPSVREEIDNAAEIFINVAVPINPVHMPIVATNIDITVGNYDQQTRL